MDELTPEQLEQALAVSRMSTDMFVYYDESGNVTGISNEKNESLMYAKVDESKVTEFLSGAKDFSKYKIDYFTFNKEDHKEEPLIEIPANLIYVVPFVKKEDIIEIVITHDKENKTWSFNLNESGVDIVKKQNLFKPYRFYIIKDNNPQFLLSTIELTGEELLESPTIAFKSKFENHVKTVGIATMKEFNSYGLLVK
jgi:uncharacterized protein YuzE